MANNLEKKYYYHFNLSRQELRQAVIENASFRTYPPATVGGDLGLLYYDIILKRLMIWDGNHWKICQYLDERDFVNNKPVFLSNIWTQSRLIPTTNITDARNSQYVEEQIDIQLEYVPNSYSYKFPSTFDYTKIVPAQFGSFYTPVLKSTKIPGFQIAANYRGWRLRENEIFFADGFDDSIYNETFAPVITLFAYTGTLGDFSYVVGEQTILTFEISQVPYNEISFPLDPLAKIVRVTCNSLDIYTYHYDTVNSKLVIEEVLVGYQIEAGDTIRVHVTTN